MSALMVLELDPKQFDIGEKSKVDLALVRAINKTSDWIRTRSAVAIRETIAFPASYLNPGEKRLWVRQRAKVGSFEALISGRGRGTSLARFSKDKPLPPGERQKGGEVSVTVRPGVTKKIKRGFIIRLKNGNLGLGTRTKGGPPPGAYKPKEISPNLWLLYGPSVDQALVAASNEGGVFDDISVEALDRYEAEFNRQLDLLNG